MSSNSDLFFYRRMHDEGDVWREETWVSRMGNQVQPFFSAAVSTCVFHDGVHVIAGPDCPHNKDYNGGTDEYEPGWTVLNNRKEITYEDD